MAQKQGGAGAGEEALSMFKITHQALAEASETDSTGATAAELGDAGSWEEEAGVFHVPGGRGPGMPSSPHLAPGHPTLAWSREAALSLHRQGACRGRELAEERTRDRPPACGSQTLP